MMNDLITIHACSYLTIKEKMIENQFIQIKSIINYNRKITKLERLKLISLSY
jgi:hypothetical protein